MRKTNDDILLEFLQEGKVITTRNAPDELGIADERAHIRNLRNKGIKVLDRWREGINRRGRRTYYKEYFL